ncbi:histidine utilization repressor [Chitinivorax sp. B]|uniref:histidine utilization repressor n=1 Tax=Chitinivorax sp. B TaxID=2502235 RepID=UPI00148552A2|nr:histidine utilization repressor [Chitinivorax sp. B]
MTQPRYQAIKSYLLQRIREQTYQPGSKIPPEVQLAEQFGVSRMTVNKAIRDLVGDGMLVRFAGDGTYVADTRAESPLLSVCSIAGEIRRRGHEYDNTVLMLRSEVVDDTIALRLGVRVGTAVYHSMIVHRENGIPIQLEDRYLNPRWVPNYLEQDFADITPNEYLTQACPLSDIEHIVEAIMPDEETQRLLEISPNEPCLLVHRRTWSADRLVSFARLTHPGTRYKLRSQVHVDV